MMSNASVCGGVGRWHGPRVECGASLTPGRRSCDRCSCEIERRQGVERDSRAAAEQDARLRLAGVSESVICGSKSLNTVRTLSTEHSRAVDAARSWASAKPADGLRLNVLLRGATGLGKTHIAECALYEAVKAGRGGRFVNARDLFLEIQGTFSADSGVTQTQIVKRYADAGFLVLDDLGASKPSRFASDTLYSILEARCRNMRPTFVTTNYASEALAQRLMPLDGGADDLDATRVVERLLELCPVKIFLKGESQRIVGARK